ncbi:hypothetical protein Bca4012_035576 [Brassica carinata]|uniref:Disease resistance R13L4/SHOC-2-like LRR domain-containing protein n=1 Tax=Brassica carinata TaxID=52824 RepID=A0A8X7WBL8_BRACI|nr:hypothetical protein Bca52824_009357 [Brassica carinata]
MVSAVKEDLSCSWEYCQMHDMIREVFSTTSTSTINAHTPPRSRRLVLHGGSALDMLGRKSNQKARFVLSFGLDINLWKQLVQGLQNLQILRVLDLSLQLHGINDHRGGWRIPSSIGKLIHLRYLSLDMGCTTHVHFSLRNLKLLIYLRIFSFQIIHLPSIFKEIVELRFLMLPQYVDAKTKLELGNLVNMKYLTCFQSEYGSITSRLFMYFSKAVILLKF